MATSSTNTYNTTRGRLVELALIDVVGGPGTTIDPNLRTHANDLLNVLVKELEVDGAALWRTIRRTLAITAGTSAYVLTNDVYDIDGPLRYTTAGQTSASQVTSWTRDEFMTIGDRTLQGTPIKYFAEKALDVNGLEQITLYFYPTPSSADTVELAVVVKSRDATDDSQTMDFSQKWLNCLRYGLAMNLGMAYGIAVDRIEWFRARFQECRDKCLGDDNERGNLTIVPFGSYYTYSSRGGCY